MTNDLGLLSPFHRLSRRVATPTGFPASCRAHWIIFKLSFPYLTIWGIPQQTTTLGYIHWAVRLLRIPQITQISPVSPKGCLLHQQTIQTVGGKAHMDLQGSVTSYTNDIILLGAVTSFTNDITHVLTHVSTLPSDRHLGVYLQYITKGS